MHTSNFVKLIAVAALRVASEEAEFGCYRPEYDAACQKPCKDADPYCAFGHELRTDKCGDTIENACIAMSNDPAGPGNDPNFLCGTCYKVFPEGCTTEDYDTCEPTFVKMVADSGSIGNAPADRLHQAVFDKYFNGCVDPSGIFPSISLFPKKTGVDWGMECIDGGLVPMISPCLLADFVFKGLPSDLIPSDIKAAQTVHAKQDFVWELVDCTEAQLAPWAPMDEALLTVSCNGSTVGKEARCTGVCPGACLVDDKEIELQADCGTAGKPPCPASFSMNSGLFKEADCGTCKKLTIHDQEVFVQLKADLFGGDVFSDIIIPDHLFESLCPHGCAKLSRSFGEMTYTCVAEREDCRPTEDETLIPFNRVCNKGIVAQVIDGALEKVDVKQGVIPFKASVKMETIDCEGIPPATEPPKPTEEDTETSDTEPAETEEPGTSTTASSPATTKATPAATPYIPPSVSGAFAFSPSILAVFAWQAAE